MKNKDVLKCQAMRDEGKTLLQVANAMGVSTWMVRKYTSTPKSHARRQVMTRKEGKFRIGMCVSVVKGDVAKGKTGTVVEVLTGRGDVLPYLKLLIGPMTTYVLQAWCVST